MRTPNQTISSHATEEIASLDLDWIDAAHLLLLLPSYEPPTSPPPPEAKKAPVEQPRPTLARPQAASSGLHHGWGPRF